MKLFARGLVRFGLACAVVGVIAFTYQFVRWSRAQPRFVRLRGTHAVVIRIDSPTDTIMRALVAIGGLQTDSAFHAERVPYLGRPGFPSAPFLMGDRWDCWGGPFADSIQGGKCYDRRASIRVAYVCQPSECIPLKGIVLRTVDELLAGTIDSVTGAE